MKKGFSVIFPRNSRRLDFRNGAESWETESIKVSFPFSHTKVFTHCIIVFSSMGLRRKKERKTDEEIKRERIVRGEDSLI